MTLDTIAMTRLVLIEVAKGNAYSKYSTFNPTTKMTCHKLLSKLIPKLPVYDCRSSWTQWIRNPIVMVKYSAILSFLNLPAISLFNKAERYQQSLIVNNVVNERHFAVNDLRQVVNGV
jgi:hypothetical protein